MNRYQITGIIYIQIGMNEWLKRYTWEFPHKTQRAHSARSTHAIHRSVTYYEHTVSILWANEAAEHLICSKKKKKKRGNWKPRLTCICQSSKSILEDLKRSEVLRSLRHYLRAQSHTPSIAWRREAWKDDALNYLPSKDERGTLSRRQILELFQRQS